MKRRLDLSPHKTPMAEQSPAQRVRNQEEVALGYTEAEARAEAERCLDCPDRWCVDGCPAHNRIPEFIAKLREGDFAAAYALLRRTNQMPGVTSRVCACEEQCERRCTRAIRSEQVAIGALERFVADWAHAHGLDRELPPVLHLRAVAVVGAGPAGMTCACSLAKAGFQVTIFEQGELLGGIPAYVIPPFVLPGEVVSDVVGQLEQLGVELRTGCTLGKNLALGSLREDFDAVFLAVGAAASRALNVPGETLPGVHQAMHYLIDEDRTRARRVAVIGGGNTALDAARTAVRMGAERVTVVYRRTRGDMPAGRRQRALAEDEGVRFEFLASPCRITAADGALCVELMRMRPDRPEYPGGRWMVAPAGQTFPLTADLVIAATGFTSAPVAGVALRENGCIAVDEHYRTSLPGVWAGGDAVTGMRTVAAAVNAGRAAAVEIFSALS